MAKKQTTKKICQTTTTQAKGASATAAGRRGSNRRTASSKRPAQRKLTAKPAEIDFSKPGFPIVGIGASAGGLEAWEELLDHLPADTVMSFVVVTHQHPGHASLLPELLGKETEMPVVVAADGAKLESNHVYVGPPGGHLALLNGTLHRTETEKKKAPRLPIDYFFRLLHQDQSETVGNLADLFEVVDKKWKILRRKATSQAIHALPEIPALSLPPQPRGHTTPAGSTRTPPCLE